jgi:hypothetical protein
MALENKILIKKGGKRECRENSTGQWAGIAGKL